MLYDNARYLVFCVIVLLVAGYTSLALRIFTRLKNRTWGWDDTCAALSAVPFAWLCAETIIAANNGLGAHSWHITTAMQMEAFKAFVMFQVAYCSSIILIKMSIALMLIRIISGQKIILWILRITIVIFTTITLAVAIYCLCQCRPLAKVWNPALEGYCYPSNILASLSMTVTVTSIISDVIISFLPIPLLYHVQINRNSKVAAGFLLSLGFFASICAIIRLAYTLALNSTEDYLFHVYGVTVWCVAEVGVALTVGCASTLRPMFRSCLGGGSGSTAKGTKATHQGPYELRTGTKNGVIHSTVERGEIKRTGSESETAVSFTDNESSREILGPSDIRVTHQYDVTSDTKN